MTLPKFPGKYQSRQITGAEHWLKYMESIGKTRDELPENAIIHFHPLQWLTNDSLETRAFYDQTISVANDKVLIQRSGGGGPCAAMAIEPLIAAGVKRFIVIGSAGALQDYKFGDIAVCEKALRDEGTSYHYLPESDYVDPSDILTIAIQQELLARNIPHSVAPTWTTDAIARETLEEVEKYQNQGIATVDMEAASLFAVAQMRGVEAAAIFTISDRLAKGHWERGFRDQATMEGFKTLYKAAVATLSRF
jgi:uridine phosphorylase